MQTNISKHGETYINIFKGCETTRGERESGPNDSVGGGGVCEMTQGERESGRGERGSGRNDPDPPEQCRPRSDATERGCLCPCLRSSVRPSDCSSIRLSVFVLAYRTHKRSRQTANCSMSPYTKF